MNDTAELGLNMDILMNLVPVLQGLLIVPPNILVVLAVMYYHALRREKEHILVMAQSLADALNVLGYMSLGARSVYIHLTGQAQAFIPYTQCLKLPHVILWTFADVNAQLMLTVISVDRLLSVGAPLKYIKLRSSYAKKLTFGCYAFTITMGLQGYVLGYSQPDELMYPATRCRMTSVLGSSSLLGQIYRQYLVYGPQVFVLLSIVLYALVPCVYSYKKNQLAGVSVSDKVKIKRQRKVTKTFAIASVCTLCIVFIPYRLAYVVLGMDERLFVFASFLWSLTTFNSLVNLLVFQQRHPELKKAVKGFIRCKTLPPTLTLWNVNTNAEVHVL